MIILLNPYFLFIEIINYFPTFRKSHLLSSTTNLTLLSGQQSTVRILSQKIPFSTLDWKVETISLNPDTGNVLLWNDFYSESVLYSKLFQIYTSKMVDDKC